MFLINKLVALEILEPPRVSIRKFWMFALSGEPYFLEIAVEHEAVEHDHFSLRVCTLC